MSTDTDTSNLTFGILSDRVYDDIYGISGKMAMAYNIGSFKMKPRSGFLTKDNLTKTLPLNLNKMSR